MPTLSASSLSRTRCPLLQQLLQLGGPTAPETPRVLLECVPRHPRHADEVVIESNLTSVLGDAPPHEPLLRVLRRRGLPALRQTVSTS